MPRNASGVYSLPVASYISGTTIKSADMNSNLNDIATALTQSLATTGVTAMTAPLPLASGTVGAPSLTFSSNPKTGFYLAGANQIGWAANGVNGALFNADTSVTWAGNQTFSSNVTVTGATTLNGAIALNAAATLKAALIFGAGGSFDPSTIFIASGASHAVGVVPDPGAVAGTTRFLREDATWAAPAASKGECQLVLNGANLQLNPYNGNILFINSVGVAVPDAGITLAIGAAVANTFYYIYAFMSAGVMTLEFSTTAPTAQAGTGIKIKTGDATRTLVGAAYTDNPAAWRDTDGKLWTLSWFNRRRKKGRTTFSADRSTASTTFTELNTEIRNQFISWAEEIALYNLGGSVFSNAAVQGTGISSGVGIDSTTVAEVETFVTQSWAAQAYRMSHIIVGQKSGLTEAAVHYATLLGGTSNNTATWSSATSISSQTAAWYIDVVING